MPDEVTKNEITNESNDQGVIEGILSDYWKGEPATEPEGDLEQETGGGEGEPEVTPEPEQKPIQPEPVATKPAEPKLYTFKGQKYTLEQLVESGKFEDALTGAEQVAHYQRLYEDAKQQPQQTPQQQPQQQQQQRISPQQIQAAYAEEIDKSIKEGYMDEGFAYENPKLAAGMLYHRDLLYHLYGMVNQMASVYQQAQANAAKTQIDNYLNGLMDAAVRSDDTYSPLNDPDTRKGFTEFLYQLDPYTDRVDETFIKKQFMAFQADAIVEAAKRNSATAESDRKKKLSQAAGESSNPRPSTVKKDSSIDQEMLDAFLEDTFPTGG